jgi:hypothetical protein
MGRLDMKCPKCGEIMDEGYLAVYGMFRGMKWLEKPSYFAVGGETILPMTQPGEPQAHRCVSCRLVVFPY